MAVFISFHSFFLFGSVAVISRKTDSSLAGHKQNLLCTKTQKKGMTPQETEPKLPASVGWFPVGEAWIGRGHHRNGAPAWKVPLGGRHQPEGGVISGQKTPGREHNPTHQQMVGLKLY